MVRSRKPKVNMEVITERTDEFQIKLQNYFVMLREGKDEDENVDEMAKQFTETIMVCAHETTGRDCKSKKERLKDKTKELLKKKRDMAGK